MSENANNDVTCSNNAPVVLLPVNTTLTPDPTYQEDIKVNLNVQQAKFVYDQEMASIKLDTERWKNRRMMAWICLGAIIGDTLLMMFLVPIKRVPLLSDVTTWFYMGCFSIIGTYIGTSTWAYIKKSNPMSGNALGAGPASSPSDSNPFANKDSSYYSEK